VINRVIEKATGNDYGDDIDRRIITPLHLTSTSVPTTRVTLPRPSGRAYSKLAETDTGPAYDVTELNARLAYGSGQMVSSPADLNRFYSALLRGRLLPPEQLKKMKTTVESSRETSRYGLGLVDRKLSCGVHVWGHDGGISGSHSDAVTTEDGRHLLAVNFNGDWSGSTRAIIEAKFCGKQGLPLTRRGRRKPGGPSSPRSVTTGAVPRHTRPDRGRPRPSGPCGPPSPAVPGSRGASWA
jgi:D-alanyl-D-alanine carboxypeptidase